MTVITDRSTNILSNNGPASDVHDTDAIKNGLYPHSSTNGYHGPPTSAAYPLTAMQQGMLFHSLLAPRSGVYIQQQICTLRERIDATTLEDAWQRVVARHPILRTSFQLEGAPSGVDEPQQMVHPHVDLPFTTHDWQHLAPPAQEQALTTLIETDRRTDFDPTAAPLMRLALCHLADAHYQLIWSYHHALLDGRSRLLILREVFTIYDALQRGEEPALAQPRPFRDHIDWLQKQDLAAARNFWMETLAGFTTPTPLPADKHVATATEPSADEAVNRVVVAEEAFAFSAADTAALQMLANTANVTQNTLVQAAWALLLSRYSSEDDVVFGATRACRHTTVDGADAMIGLFINTLPVRVAIEPAMPVAEWLQTVRARWVAMRDHEQAPLAQIQEWSEIPRGAQLFDSSITFENYLVGDQLHEQGGNWAHREFKLLQRTNFPLELAGYGGPELRLVLRYDQRRFSQPTVARMMGHLTTILRNMAANPQEPVSAIGLLTDGEVHQLLHEWNDTATDYARNACIHQLFEEQVARTPNAVALAFEDVELTYQELNARANQMAHHLVQLGVGPETRVGVYMARSIDMVVGLLGILKAGGAYIPLDPTYPADRVAFMMADAELAVLLTAAELAATVPAYQGVVVQVDADWSTIATQPTTNVASAVAPHNLSYVIYTSGSTGKPKGVMVCHRNVVNFCAGMDERIPHDPPGAWLAVTSLSFDISVLELFWTLARGFKIVLHADQIKESTASTPSQTVASKAIDFSLFYFASDESEDGVTEKYKLLLDGAKYADEHGFAAVWTPERHFHAFGGLYPNPAVTGAAIAAITERVGIRAGSCVLPLHSPIRVAEEWALVDNLSNGRVGIAAASGWQPHDFVLKPENFVRRKEAMFDDIETVRRLWRGETLTMPGPDERPIDVHTLPRPVQAELPVWVTAAGNPETFRQAGEQGFHLLTHLLGQTVTELAEKLAIYRQAWLESGHLGQGHVTLMLHTFVSDDVDYVREIVRGPMREYLRSAVGLIKDAAMTFPDLKKRAEISGQSPLQIFESGDLSTEDMEALLDHAFARYFETSGLFGTPESCLALVNELKAIDVDEIACLIDFGVPSALVLDNLPRLKVLKDRANGAPEGDYSIAAQLRQHNVTHIQCTPSLMKILLLEDDVRGALANLDACLIGGEAFPADLAAELTELVPGKVINMYGPTETTIWSTTHLVDGAQDAVPIGRPIANTMLYILDRRGQPAPVGIPGELFIGGDGVVRGYHNRPELTAERFVSIDDFGLLTDDCAPGNNPQSKIVNRKLYRTGDLARYRADGTIDFLGRLDHQVKIRGNRIELGEIENALAQHDAVQKNVVVARQHKDVAGEQMLVAYIVARTPAPATDELRQLLKQTLPEFMIPSAFIFMDGLPLTPNGKIDRNGLPGPEQARTSFATEFVAPRTPIEEALADIWAGVIGIDRVGAHDDFFDLGGHSLQAIRCIAQVRNTFLVDLPLRNLFDAPTVASLSATLVAREQHPGQTEKIASALQRVKSMSTAEVGEMLAAKRRQEDAQLAISE